MAAFDAVARGYLGSGTVLTYTHTVTGTNPFLAIGNLIGGGDTDVVLTYTYALDACTKSTGGANNGNYSDIYYKAAPATGSNSVAITLSASREIYSESASYTGIDQSTPADGSQGAGYDSSGTSHTRTVTVGTTGSWMFMNAIEVDHDAMVGGTGTTARSTRWGDSNGGLTAGARTLEMTDTSGRCYKNGALAFKVVAAAAGIAASRRTVNAC